VMTLARNISTDMAEPCHADICIPNGISGISELAWSDLVGWLVVIRIRKAEAASASAKIWAFHFHQSVLCSHVIN